VARADYPDHANPDLLGRIPLTARRILDVGCGAGALGLAYKRRNPAARYLGIEADPRAAAIAAGRLDAVAHCDVEAQPAPFDDARFDCIIYGDILEHLRDPWRVLRAHAAVLAPGGVMLVCMPNAEHWSFSDRLLRGGWDYEAQGLFDRTHLRWFTPDTTRAALIAAGVRPIDVIPRIFDLAPARAFAAGMAPLLGQDPEALLRRCAPLQHVWRAGVALPPRLHVRATMLAPVGGVSAVRVSEPIAALATDPAVDAAILDAQGGTDPPADAPRILVLHRPLLTGESGLATLRGFVRRGYLTVCEFDDHPDFIPVLQRPDVQNFRAVHAVQTSTEPLAAHFRAITPEVAVFPNAIAVLPEVRNHAGGPMTLFYGGLNRQHDWPACVPALNEVAAAVGARLRFRIVGDRGLFDALTTPHKSFSPLCDYASYLDLLGQSEISLMPLEDNLFNRCKSDLKFIEAAAARVAALASPVVYGDSIEDGRTGMLFRDAGELRQRLMRLVASPDIARVIGNAARAGVARHRMLAYQVAPRVAWCRRLWERRAELRASLAERVPELGRPGTDAPGTRCDD
jgi:SAM-dependent methyltransferase